MCSPSAPAGGRARDAERQYNIVTYHIIRCNATPIVIIIIIMIIIIMFIVMPTSLSRPSPRAAGPGTPAAARRAESRTCRYDYHYYY